jgi:DNA repair protein RadD
MRELYDYQSDGVRDIRAKMRDFRRVLYVLPTGGGKTFVFSYITEAAEAKGNTVYIISHRQEIADQISDELAEMGVPHGMIRAGEPRTDHKVQVCMVMTLARRLESIERPDLAIIDEAHHAAANTWRKIFEAWHGTYFLGFTATPQRNDGQGLRDCFDVMVEGPDVRWLIDHGRLADFDYYAPDRVDLMGVRKRGGDYAAEDLEDVMSQPAIVGSAVANYRLRLIGRTAIAFCVTVAHARYVANGFNAAGISAAVIDGNMSSDERRDLVEKFRCGEVTILASCEVISEGFNVPNAGGAILLRPTQSLVVYAQQVGRALRVKDDLSRAVIIDHVGNYYAHGRPDEPHHWTLDGDDKKEKDGAGKGRAPSRECKECARIFSINHQQDWCEGSPVGCLFAPPEEVEGTLVEVEKPEGHTADWSDGIDILTARGWAWYRLVDLAGDDEAKVRQIQEIRGYRKGWIWHHLRERKARGGC